MKIPKIVISGWTLISLLQLGAFSFKDDFIKLDLLYFPIPIPCQLSALYLNHIAKVLKNSFL